MQLEPIFDEATNVRIVNVFDQTLTLDEYVTRDNYGDEYIEDI